MGNRKKTKNQITQILTDSRSKLKELSQSIDNTDLERRKLIRALKDLNAEAFIAKLKHDFYHVREFTGKAEIIFKQAIPDSEIRIFDADHVTLVGGNFKQDLSLNGEKFAEFYQVEGTLTSIGSGETTSRIKMSYALFSMFDDRILERPDYGFPKS